ncbi:D-glycerate dehydrogenase [Marinobacterium nitratireducens]|uniref:D-glycerate dehydrogenase n=1 Tax=Marinobacterium nitratireducens TaxID=518897 RepID=A0A918DPR8_9GAMM|nr:D-glycerate dehydrogenase [Marinobacterium nitratireducens]GGO78988.1 D-glycerate dehydrogenase [Marinobacterium nitratireducens]
MSNAIILLTRPLPQPMIDALGQFGEVRVMDASENIGEGNILVSTPLDPIDADLIARLPESLGLIANIGVGIDHIDLAAARARGIAVSNTPVVTEDTADLAFTLILATCRRLGIAERHLRNDDWAAGVSQMGQRVHGKTLGIVGFGAIGQAVARRARGFNMNIIYHGRSAKPEAEAEIGARYCETLEELLAEADIVSLNCDLNDSTRHLINADTLAKMKPNATLINTGRGPLIDEAALVDALKNGQLGGVGLDVYEFEPKVTPELKEFDRVTLSPHIGSATQECRGDMARRVCMNIAQFVQQGAPGDCCN